MDLTAWQRICNRLLGGFVKKRARNDKELSSDLVKASIGMMPEVYRHRHLHCHHPDVVGICGRFLPA
jgi:hypothetical protein